MWGVIWDILVWIIVVLAVITLIDKIRSIINSYRRY